MKFIEKNSLIVASNLAHDVFVRGNDLCCQEKLIRKIDETVGTLIAFESFCDIKKEQAVPIHLNHFLEIPRRLLSGDCSDFFKFFLKCTQCYSSIVQRHILLGDMPRQRQDGGNDGCGRLVLLIALGVFTPPVFDDTAEHLDLLCLPDEPRIWINADCCAVFSKDPRGERVICESGRLSNKFLPAIRGKGGEVLAHFQPELTGGFSRKGQAEDTLGIDAVVGDHVEYPLRHRGCFSSACSCNDEEWFKWSLNNRALFFRRCKEGLGARSRHAKNLVDVQFSEVHGYSTLLFPWSFAGQDLVNSQYLHASSDGVAIKCGPRIREATSSSWLIQSFLLSSSSGS